MLAGKLDVSKSFVDFGALSMETYGLYQCRVFCRDAFGNPVTNIEASDIKIHISGGEVKLRNDGPDASEKGNMFSVSKDADRQGELIFTFVPVTSGSAHILVSTPSGERFKGTPKKIQVIESAPLPASYISSLTMPDINGQQGEMWGQDSA